MPTHRTTTSALLQARIPLDLVAQAEQLAARLGCTVSDLLREGLARRLASDNPPDTPTVELSGAVRQYIDRQIEAVVSARLTAAGHAPAPLDPPPGRRARRDVPPPDRPSDGAYDATKFYLATLCKRGHDWEGTGQSLLRRGNSTCVQCQRELRRARAARQIR